jgi:hypothetical protein
MGPQMNRLRDIAHFMLRPATDQGSTRVETENETYILLRMVLLNWQKLTLGGKSVALRPCTRWGW